MYDIFEVWQEWNGFPDNFVVGDRGAKGVYAFRLKIPFNRLVVESQILYIGKSENEAGIFYRVRNYMQKNQGAVQRLRDIKDIFGEEAIQYSYVICENPATTETELLHAYYKAHLELPPMNRNHRAII